MPDDYNSPMTIPSSPLVTQTLEDIKWEGFKKRFEEFERRLPSELARIASGERGTLFVYCVGRQDATMIQANLIDEHDEDYFLRNYYAHFNQIEKDGEAVLVAVFPDIPVGNYKLYYNGNHEAGQTKITVFPNFTVEMMWPASHTQPE